MAEFRGVRNANGRPKGAVNKTTAQTKKIIEKLVSSELKNIDSLLEQLKPKDRIEALIKLLPFVIPKQQEISIDAPHQLQPMTLTIVETLQIAANEES
jgi:hypothetical protein